MKESDSTIENRNSYEIVAQKYHQSSVIRLKVEKKSYSRKNTKNYEMSLELDNFV